VTADAGVAIGPSWPAATLTRTAASSRPLMLPSLAAAAESAGRFHLLPIDRAVTTGERGSLGRPFRRRDEDVEVTSREAVTARDPDAAGRGLRAHNRLQNRLSDLVRLATSQSIPSHRSIRRSI
jgi:hypothetical protein